METGFCLKYTNVAPDVWEGLARTSRTGWVIKEIKNPESVQEHTISCRNLVMKLDYLSLINEFSEKEIIEILDMLEVHDWPEKITGDQVIVTYDLEKRKRLKDEKFKAELKAMNEICNDLGFKGKKIFDLWIRFERKQDKVSIFANQVDKYQCIEKAYEYEGKGENIVVQDFIDYHKDEIKHYVLRNMMLDIEHFSKIAGITNQMIKILK